MIRKNYKEKITKESKNFLAFGKNTVLHLIESPYFSVKRIIINKSFQEKKILSISKAKKIIVETIENEKFLKYNFDKKNQGIVAFLKNYNYCSLDFLIRSAKNQERSILLMLDSIEDPHNFGAILRTCAAMNVSGLIIGNKNQVPVNNTVIKVSVGGIGTIPICKVDSLSNSLDELKKNNFQIISTVCDEKSLPSHKIEAKFPICLILGNEHVGVRKNLVEKSDLKAYIPISNKIQSINVSVACGMLLYELCLKNY